MERKIGEIFEYKGEWYQCVESHGCALCAFNETDCNDIDIGDCASYKRSDGKSVIFKKLEKVGEPYVIEKVLYQHYKVFDIDNVYGDGFFWCVHNYKARTLTIELKQNKEDMEEKKQKLDKLVDDYMACRIQYAEFDREIKALYDKEGSEPTLKKFSFEAAKAGKPVCTRDGRKARIICFDRKSETPITVLVTEINGIEAVYSYPNNGIWDSPENTNGCDLMMLPEKKEGWVNVYKRENEYICENECNVSIGIAVYKSEGEAKRNINKNEIYVNTIKITWEE